jgi:hypothetical protein
MVARNRSSEVLLTFQPAFLTRHGMHPAHRESGDAAFGGTHWQGVFEKESSAKLDFLVQAYRESIVLAGFQHSLAFEMVDEGGHKLWLLFATSSLLGIEKMKDAMWSVDTGVRYRDPRDPAQMYLDIAPEPDAAPLGRMLLERLADGPQTLDELREWTNVETVYKKGHVLKSVREMSAAGEVSRPAGRLLGDSKIQVSPVPFVEHDQGSLF